MSGKNMSYLFWSFVILSIVLVNGKKISVSIDPQYIPVIASASLDCIQKTGVQPDILQQVISGKFEESDAVKKFIYCLATTSGYAEKNGHIITDMFVKLIGDNKYKNQYAEVIAECSKSEGHDKYETIYNAAVCFRDKSPIVFKL